MVHLNEETFSDVLDGAEVTGASEHLAKCGACRDQLAILEELRARLKELPEIEAPAHLWGAIEARISADPAVRRRRLGWPGVVALQAAAMAAVFVIGLGLGAMFIQDGADETTPAAQATSSGGQGSSLVALPPASLDDAYAEVQRRGAEYDAALTRLEDMARRAGQPMPQVALERLAALDVLLEATRTALAADPADEVLNSYLFAALEERDNVMLELAAERSQTNSEVAWR